jgi:hypothetical protein
MALLTAQLLFVERCDEIVRLDLIVLARADAPRSPRVGEPLAIDLALPSDAVVREASARLLRRWAEASSVIDLDLVDRPGRTMVRLTSPLSSITLDDPHHAA